LVDERAKGCQGPKVLAINHKRKAKSVRVGHHCSGCRFRVLRWVLMMCEHSWKRKKCLALDSRIWLDNQVIRSHGIVN
jgi:hypothetical protein